MIGCSRQDEASAPVKNPPGRQITVVSTQKVKHLGGKSFGNPMQMKAAPGPVAVSAEGTKSH
jgi:hypothetical protein